ncbi:MAG TPA: ATP-dependent Clp protease ATP-binding subunit ClpC, partial [Candidatus Latescibacteria bacterium]|nr:ATP-dependent Clp protease ATP-binding subunit ClpC [Candidatus Latescibacterota bacterium]
DMSEYMERFSTSRLIGAPPGYVGYEEGGQLTEKVRRKPYSVVLFDEIEKAHPDFFHLLLQVLDEGHITDSFGRRVDFKNTILIMTSNIGTRHAQKGKGLGFVRTEEEDYEGMKERILEEVKRTFSPEFINRVDEIIVFRPLSKEAVLRIVDILLREVKDRIETQGMRLDVSSGAKALLAEKGYDPTFGARPLKRTIQKHISDPLAEDILEGKFGPGDLVRVIRRGNGLSFVRVQGKSPFVSHTTS